MNGYHTLGFIFTSVVFLVLVVMGIDHRFFHERLFRFIAAGDIADIVFAGGYALSFISAPLFLVIGYLKDRRRRIGPRLVPFAVHIAALVAGNLVMFLSIKAPSAKVLIIPGAFTVLYAACVALTGYVRQRRFASRYGRSRY